MTKRPALRPEAALGDVLAAVARDILAEAQQAMADRGLPAETAVHDFRKSMKRWRAFLRTLTPLFGDTCRLLRGEARDLARGLGGARDLQSAQEALEEIREQPSGISVRSYGTMIGKIESLRKDAEVATLDPQKRETLTNAVAAWASASALWRYGEIEFSAIAEALADDYRRARRDMPAEWHDVELADLHEFRQRVVEHRYQMELIEPLWPKMGKLWVDEVQRLRDALGHHRDLATLAALAGPHQPLARYRSKLAPLIAAQQKAHVRQAEKLAGRIFAEKPKAFRHRIEALWQSRGRRKGDRETA